MSTSFVVFGTLLLGTVAVAMVHVMMHFSSNTFRRVSGIDL